MTKRRQKTRRLLKENWMYQRPVPKNMNQKSIKTDRRENTLIAICNLDSTTQETKTILIHCASYVVKNCQTKPCYLAN